MPLTASRTDSKTELDAAYAICKRLNAHHGKTYYFSTLFFPAEIRRSVHALYGFVRYPDEIVDNPAPGSDPAASLENYREATRDALKTGGSDLPVLHAFADMAHRHALPRDAEREVDDGVRPARHARLRPGAVQHVQPRRPTLLRREPDVHGDGVHDIDQPFLEQSGVSELQQVAGELLGVAPQQRQVGAELAG